jgi:hypothetical protein
MYPVIDIDGISICASRHKQGGLDEIVTFVYDKQELHEYMIYT